MKLLKNLFFILLAMSGILLAKTRSIGFPKLTGPYLGQKLPVIGAELFAPGIVSTGMTERSLAISTDGRTLYFTRSKSSGEKSAIWRSRWLEGKFQPAETLPEIVNGKGTLYNTFIAPDESYLIACVNGREDNLTPGAANYYIFFRSADDHWSAGVNLGAGVNFPGATANAPYVTRDGKYFFFASNIAKPLTFPSKAVTTGMLLEYFSGPQNGGSDIYWREASFLKKLRPEGLK